MGKGQAFRAKSAITIDRRRLGAIAVLLIEIISLATFLAPATVRKGQSSYLPLTPAYFEAVSPRFDAPEVDSPSKLAFYAYSVIPGGANTVAELRNAVANDATVRAHYSDFAIANARVERLGKAQAFYVSYRIGANIFWTKNPLTLRANEGVLTDGVHLARTRCGNRLSLAPVAPVSKIEPVPAAMEVAEAAVLPAAIETPVELPLVAPPLTAIVTSPVMPAPPPVGIYLPPPFFPIGAGGGPPTPGIPTSPTPPVTPPSGPRSGPTPPPVTPPPATPPPIATPEPSALLMLAAGFVCMIGLKKLR